MKELRTLSLCFRSSSRHLKRPILERALVFHPFAAGAAVIGYTRDVKDQGIYIFVSPVEVQSYNNELTSELERWVRKGLSPIATPDMIQWIDGLPKTRSGKLMRRNLHKIAAIDYDQLGDVST